MKRTKTLLICMVTLLYFNQTFAQDGANNTVADKIIKNYPDYVIFKLNDVLKRVPLNNKKQEALAKFYVDKKTLLTDAVKNKNEKQQIILKDSLQAAFANILSKTELDTYYSAKAKNDKGLSIITEKYKVNEADQEKIKTIIFKKELQWAKISDLQNDPLKIDSLKSKELKRYHKELDQFLITAGYKKDESPAAKAEEKLNFYVDKYQLNDAYKETLRPLMLSKYKKIAAVNDGNTSKAAKDSAINAINDKYNKQVDKFLAINNKASKTSKIHTLVSYKNTLQLSTSQIDSLINYAASKKTTGKLQSKPLENDDIKIASTLDNTQYLKYLSIVNKEKAVEKSKADWKEATKFGLTSNLDSTATIKELTSYYINYYVIKQRKDIDTTQQQSEAIKLKNALPQLVNRLNTVKKMPNAEMAKKQGFAW